MVNHWSDMILIFIQSILVGRDISRRSDSQVIMTWTERAWISENWSRDDLYFLREHKMDGFNNQTLGFHIGLIWFARAFYTCFVIKLVRLHHRTWGFNDFIGYWCGYFMGCITLYKQLESKVGLDMINPLTGGWSSIRDSLPHVWVSLLGWKSSHIYRDQAPHT
jgi:hypothetical protein